MIDPTAREGVELGQIPELAEGRWHGPLHCPDPEEILLRRERQDLLAQYAEALLDQVSRTDREALLAWARGNASEYQAANDLTPGAFNTRVCRAHPRLSEAAKKTLPPDELIYYLRSGR